MLMLYSLYKVVDIMEFLGQLLDLEMMLKSMKMLEINAEV
jgi:hypothetical protein